MQFKLTNLTLVVMGASLLGGCNSEKVKDEFHQAGDRVHAEMGRAGDHIHDGLEKVGDKLDEARGKLTLNAEKESLRQLGLDEADIDYVIKNSPDDAMAVAKNSDKILSGVHFTFESSSTEITNSHIPNIQATQWSPQDKAKVEKIWGRVAFIVNSPRFENRFNDELACLDSRTFAGGVGDAVSVPADYQAFIDVASDTLRDGNNSYKLEAFVNQQGLSSGGNAWGQMGAPEVFLNPQEIAKSPVNQTAPLLLHELTHTFGYNHNDQKGAVPVVFVPNNVPYYVQLITSPGGMNDQKYPDLNALSQEIVQTNQTPFPSGLDTDLFTQYFGQ